MSWVRGKRWSLPATVLVVGLVTSCAGEPSGSERSTVEREVLATTAEADKAADARYTLLADSGTRNDLCATLGDSTRTFLGVPEHPAYTNPDNGDYFGCTFADEKDLLGGPNGGEITFLYGREVTSGNRPPTCAMEEVVGGPGQELLCTAALAFDIGVLRITLTPSVDRSTDDFAVLIDTIVSALQGGADATDSAADEPVATPAASPAPTDSQQASTANGSSSSSIDFASEMRAAADEVLGPDCYSSCSFDPSTCTELLLNPVADASALSSATNGVPTMIYCNGETEDGWLNVEVWFDATPEARAEAASSQLLYNAGSLFEQVVEMENGVCPARAEGPQSEGKTLTCAPVDRGVLYTMSDSEYALQVVVTTADMVVAVRSSFGTADEAIMGQIGRIAELLALPHDTVTVVEMILATT